MTQARNLRATIGGTTTAWSPLTPEPWTAQAVCNLDNAYLFVEIPGDREWRTQADWAREALALCKACPVRLQCRTSHLDEGVSYDHRHVRGGIYWVNGKPSRPPTQPPPITDPAEFTREEMVLAHAAHNRGERTPEVMAGERAYQRDSHERRRRTA